MTHENIPSENGETLEKSAEQLWAMLSSYFEGEFDARGYKAQLTLPVKVDSILFSDQGEGLQDYFKLTAGAPIDKQKPWTVEMGYVAGDDQLDVVRLELPLSKPSGIPSNNQSLIFHRTRSLGFTPLLKIGDVEQQIFSRTSLDVVAEHYEPAFITRLLRLGGYDMSNFKTDPDSLRLIMAQIADKTTEAKIEESVIVSPTALLQTKITRTTSQAIEAINDGNSVAYGRSYSRATDAASKENSVGYRKTFFTELLAETTKRVDRNALECEQTVVHFIGQEHSIDEVELYKQTLLQTDAILGTDEREYAAIQREDIEISLSNLNKIAEDMVDALIGL